MTTALNLSYIALADHRAAVESIYGPRPDRCYWYCKPCRRFWPSKPRLLASDITWHLAAVHRA